MKFPDVSELGSVDINGAGRFRVYMVKGGLPVLGVEEWDDVANALDALCSYPPEMEVNRERWRAISAKVRAALARTAPGSAR